MGKPMEDPEKFDSYQYRDTVFVTGNLNLYLNDLEYYFRNSAQELEDSERHCLKHLRHLRRDIEMQKKGYGFFPGIKDNYGCPFPIDENNYNDGFEWLEKMLRFRKNQYRSQRINQGKILRVTEDGDQINSLEVTNFGHRNLIVRMAFDPEYSGGSIRMRVFENTGNYGYMCGSESFAEHASFLDGLNGIVETEKIEGTCLIPGLSDYLANNRIRRSRLRLKRPAFETIDIGDSIAYSIHFQDAHSEMVKICGDASRKPVWLKYDSKTWSPGQGEVMIRDLLGVLGVGIDTGIGYRDCYSWVWVSPKNEESIPEMVEKNVFRKCIRKDGLPVLAAIFERTNELRDLYGKNFYPRFTVREASKRSGVPMNHTKRLMDDLTGVLAFAIDHRQHKWFIPRTMLGLSEEILERYYY
ncbi:MAG: hypothetical protein JW754_04830 [Candidatus Aenigmarchaeota archaeon]|nr:hypothetical protein [Candidatus Aenigmarchaeota archaeon]